ncbi:hypothetical protein Vadar_003991 [Vaccinium darrowii]|uniref:Uncharacterized protein n=1 Tax=Vaccinium darrowii TaxID=229202 RepID=A0ACB7XF90_9ERIC|nr:hypothetical protein Vadar_003991 [Vaccinium darrowii]
MDSKETAALVVNKGRECPSFPCVESGLRGEEVGGKLSFAQVLKGSSKDGMSSGVKSDILKLDPSSNDWLDRSMVAKLHKFMEVDNIIMDFEKEKINGTLIRKRFVWLSCMGIPRNIWNLESFRKIGEKWGVFMEVDDSTLHCLSFTKGRVLIATETMSTIDSSIQIEIDNIRYRVQVKEEPISSSVEVGRQAAYENLSHPYEEDAKAEARLDIGDSLSNNFHQVINNSLVDNAILRQENSFGSRAIDSPPISASMVGETKEEVDCSMANDMGHLVDVRHSILSNSFEVEDTALAVNDKDEEDSS